MKFSAPAGQLADALGYVASAMATRVVIPILGHCRMEIRDGKLSLTASDLDIELTATLDALDSEPGAITAPCGKLAKLTDALPRDAEVTLTLTDNRLVVRSGRGRWTLPTLPVEDFPVLTPPTDDAATFTLTKADVQRLIQRVGFAISDEQTRYYMMGIYLCAVDKQLCAAATNGHRLSETFIALDPGTMPGVILPAKTATALEELARDVTLQITTQRVELAADNRRVISKLIDATFPDYKRVLPTVSNNNVSVDGQALLGAAKRLSAILEAKAKEQAIGLQWGDGQFAVCLKDDAGLEEIEPLACTGKGQTAVQARYLIPQLEALDADTVTIDHIGGGYPIRVTRVDEPATTTILMPIRW